MTPRERDPLPAILYGLFFLSGLAGLIYESIWTRYLGLFVGHSAYAQIIVLVIFLGGMSAGSYFVGRQTLSVARPLFWYAVVELGTGAIGLLFHPFFISATNFAYDSVFPRLGQGMVETVVKWAIAGLLILPQSILLGMTFPLMSAGVIRRLGDQPGRGLSMLYFTNSAGASVGVLIAGFWLVGAWGLPGTLVSAAVLNVFVSVSVFALIQTFYSSNPAASASGETLRGVHPERSERAPGDSRTAAASAIHYKIDRRWQVLIGVSFFTAFSSFIYEIGWIRMLSLVLGSATHSFELMLSAFILGLALGAWWIRRRADGTADPMRTLARVQIAMGALAIATLPVYIESFSWMADFIAAFSHTAQGYIAFSIGRYAICLAVMLPATICAGMTLPLITRALLQGSAGERAIGQVYSTNTLGSIVGAAVAGLVLLPVLGVKWLLITGAFIDLGIGLWLFRELLGRSELLAPKRLATFALGVVVLAVVIVSARFDQALLSSGVYRYGIVTFRGGWPVLFHEDGRTATVSIRRVPSTGIVTLLTNGKVEGSLGPNWFSNAPVAPGPLGLDAPTQLFIPLLPLAHAPDAKRAAVIGLGSGITTHALLGSPKLQEVVTVEIEPQMFEASKAFLPANKRAYEDPRSHRVLDDARAYFATDPGKFDIIVAEPSNPWVSGVSGLFTTEFYQRARTRLTENGVFAQWLQVYEIDDDLVLSVLQAIQQNFASWEIFATSEKDVLIIAANKPLRAPDWSVMRYPGVASDLRFTWPVTAPSLERMRIGGRDAFVPLLDRLSGANSDFYPRLDLNAERTRFMRETSQGLRSLAQGVNFPAIVNQRRAGPGEPYAIIPGIDRIREMSIAAGLKSGDPRAGPEARAAAERVRAYRATLGASSPPAEWHLWARSFSEASDLVNGGMAGVADTAFFAETRRYLDAHHAPAEARAVVDFTRGMAAWDFSAAAKAADPLIRAMVRGDEWIDPDFLRDGAVISMLETGDKGGARDAFRALEPRSSRAGTDLKSQLLLSYVIKGGL